MEQGKTIKNSTGKTIQSHAKNESRSFSNIMYKIKSKCTKDLDIRRELIDFSKERIGKIFCDIKAIGIFNELIPMSKETKQR